MNTKVILISLSAVMMTYLLSLGLFNSDSKTTNQLKAQATVKILRTNGGGGGTGVIIKSTVPMSVILTNNHVCEAIKSGGTVITDDNGSYQVATFKESKVHDLCLLSVMTDLHINTKIAERLPFKYEEASVSGHPNLLPTIITKGNFSGRETIQVMIGKKTCTEEDMNSSWALYCIFMGGIPIIKTYDAQVIAPTIMGGSSGSAVYNSDGDLSGLVFAGLDGLSYAYIVPLEYILIFLGEELSSLSIQTPQQSNQIAANTTSCKNIKNKHVRQLCTMVKSFRR